MRRIAAAATAAALTITLQAQTTHRSTTTTAHRKPVATAAVTPQEGIAAVGTMPAAAGPVKTLFALRYIDLKIGDGELAETRKFYTVHYTGWTTDGKKFDSSFDHDPKEPIVFPVGVRRVIAGWDTGFEGMRIGGKRRIVVPYQLAYGADGRPPVIPAKADLIFDVELLAQNDPTPPPAPTAPAATPPDAAPKPAPQPGSNPATEPTAKPPAKPE